MVPSADLHNDFACDMVMLQDRAAFPVDDIFADGQGNHGLLPTPPAEDWRDVITESCIRYGLKDHFALVAVETYLQQNGGLLLKGVRI